MDSVHMGLQECGVTRHEEVENALHGISQHHSAAVHHHREVGREAQHSAKLVAARAAGRELATLRWGRWGA